MATPITTAARAMERCFMESSFLELLVVPRARCPIYPMRLVKSVPLANLASQGIGRRQPQRRFRGGERALERARVCVRSREHIQNLRVCVASDGRGMLGEPDGLPGVVEPFLRRRREEPRQFSQARR